jgi:hypothetical protein
MPIKYHHYADHDNNRNWVMFNLVESQHVAKVLYHEWYPEVVMDQHQMGSNAARLFIPPYSDPVNPNIPPSLMANLNMVGKHAVSDLHDRGFKGVVTGTIFNAFFEGTMSKTPLWHNRIGILTEAASVNVASPVFFPKTSLRGMGIDLPEYNQQTNFLDPWPGGWWRLRDIIEYEKATTYSMLELAATYKAKFKRNFYRLNKNAIAQGQNSKPFAYVIPVEQHDPSNAVEMLKRLRLANIDIYRATEDFTTAQGYFKEGDFIIPLAQPGRAYILDLLQSQKYPDLRDYPGGPPRRPYDVTAWTLPMQFGVRAVKIETPFAPKWQKSEPVLQVDSSLANPGWQEIERRYSNSYMFVNSLLKKNYQVYTAQRNDLGITAGNFLVNIDSDQLADIENEQRKYAVPLMSLPQDVAKSKISAVRIGIYQPWIPYAYDEGWLRLVLDRFGYRYTVVHNADVRKAETFDKFDVMIFGSQSPGQLKDGKSKNAKEPLYGAPKVRNEYTGGIGITGVQNIKKFLENGGTVLFLGDAVRLAIEDLNLPAQNALAKLDREHYFAPGSIFEIELDTRSPVTYGLQSHAFIYVNNRLALNLLKYNREIMESARYADRQPLRSGWAVGAENLHNKIALAEIPVGKGKAVLYAFRVTHRGQMFGTFKLLFNTLYQTK